MKIEYKQIDVGIRGKEILQNASLALKKGSITGIIGPNGCGKSTLIKTTFGIMPYQNGDIFIDGKSVQEMGRKRLREKIGYVGQDSNTTFDFMVREVVAMGITARQTGQKSKMVVKAALEELNIGHLEQRGIQTLSGGEKKMVFLARAIAQGTDTIILDEPTNHLDIAHQLFIMNYLKASKKSVLIVLHDLRLAAHYCDEVYLMKTGQTIGHGAPAAVMSKENLEMVFGIEGKAIQTEHGGDLWIKF